MKLLSPTMNISGGATIISGGAALRLIGYLLYWQTRQAEDRAAATEATVGQLRSESGDLRAETASLRKERRRNRRKR